MLEVRFLTAVMSSRAAVCSALEPYLTLTLRVQNGSILAVVFVDYPSYGYLDMRMLFTVFMFRSPSYRPGLLRYLDAFAITLSIAPKHSQPPWSLPAPRPI